MGVCGLFLAAGFLLAGQMTPRQEVAGSREGSTEPAGESWPQRRRFYNDTPVALIADSQPEEFRSAAGEGITLGDRIEGIWDYYTFGDPAWSQWPQLKGWQYGPSPEYKDWLRAEPVWLAGGSRLSLPPGPGLETPVPGGGWNGGTGGGDDGDDDPPPPPPTLLPEPGCAAIVLVATVKLLMRRSRGR